MTSIAIKIVVNQLNAIRSGQRKDENSTALAARRRPRNHCAEALVQLANILVAAITGPRTMRPHGILAGLKGPG